MSEYTCELCLKEFKQKIDYTRHKNKKNACVSVEQVKKLAEKKITDETIVKNMSTLFSSCMNIFRDSEHLTGDKALRNLSYLLVLRLIEPMFGKEIKLDEHKYTLPTNRKDKLDKLIKYTHFSEIASSDEEDIPGILKEVWQCILSQHPKTKDIFLPNKGFDIKKQSTFKKLVDKLSQFDFSSVKHDIQGHAYEDLLKDIMTGKVLGQYFTQPLVKDMMVELVNPQVLDDGTIETVFDPAMGTGGFLMTSLRHLQRQAETKEIKLDWDFITKKGLGGREAEPDTFQMGKANMLVSSAHMFNALEQGDSIREPIINKYDIVLANPPFGIKGLKYSEITSPLRDAYMPIESNSAVPLFLQAIISILKIGGRCAMVMPDGQELFGKGKAFVALREYLMKTCDLKEVHYLPSGVFTNTTIKTCVVYFHKKKGNDVVTIGGKKTRTYNFTKTHQTKTVKFYDYNPYEKVKNLLTEVDIDRIAENGYSLNYAEYLETKEDKEEEDGKQGDIEWKNLGEVCAFNIGGTPSRKEPTYWDNGTNLWVSVRELNGGYIYDTNEKITDLGVQKSSVKLFEQDTVLFSFKLSIGKTAMVGKPMYSNEAIAGINSKNSNILLNKFLYYYLTVTDFSGMGVGAMSNGSLNKTSLAKIRIPIPPLPVQKSIVEKFDFLYERSIVTSTAKIEDLNTEKAMLIDAMTLGTEKKILGELCKTKQGTYITKKTITKGQYPVYGGGDISSYTDKYNRENDMIIAKDGVSIDCVRYEEGRFFLNHHGWTLDISDNLIKKYMYYYLKCNQNILYNIAQGTAQKGINQENFYKLYIPVPSLSIQQDLVSRCESIDKLIADLESQKEQSKELANMVLKNYIGIQESEENKQEEYSQIIIEEEDKSEDEIVVVEESEDEAMDCQTLKKKSITELQSIAKEKNISGRSKMKKQELIDAILSSKEIV